MNIRKLLNGGGIVLLLVAFAIAGAGALGITGLVIAGGAQLLGLISLGLAELILYAFLGAGAVIGAFTGLLFGATLTA